MKTTIGYASACLVLCLAVGAFAKEAIEPAGKIPVLKQVDVVVVGGASGGVEAALAAAKNGASVFLVAPRPYLGEDICATYRLWLEPGETPTTDLAREVFKPMPVVRPVGPGLPFQYAANVAAAARHKDTTPPSLLTDGKWQNVGRQSVEYSDDVTFTLDLGKEQKIARVIVLAFQRPADFEVAKVTVTDGKQTAVVANQQTGMPQGDSVVHLSAPLQTRARRLTVTVHKTPESQRILLGEIVVESDAPAATTEKTAEPPRLVTPMQVKRTLEQTLIKANVTFLYTSYLAGLLRDADGKPAGVVVANRSGQQAIPAKVIIDATDRGAVARLAGAKFRDYPSVTQKFRRIVVGGPAGKDIVPRAQPLTVTDRKGNEYPIHEYELALTMRDGSFGAFADADQVARDLTWTKEAVDGSETLFQVPPDSFRAKQSFTGAWPGADRLPLDCLQPADAERIFVLNGCADVPREAAAALTRPVNTMAVGARVGEAAAVLAKQTAKLSGVKVAGAKPKQPVAGKTRDASDHGNYRAKAGDVPAEVRGLPVLGEYDVVVVGGGTGGAPAGIGAGRHGARTLLLEYLHGLGGIGTTGYISSYYHGNRVGFTREIDRGVIELGGPINTDRTWDPEHKSEWYRRELRKAGVDVWYGTFGAGAFVENGRVKGVVVLTPHGRGVVLAKTVVDATGNADIAASAGAECRYTGAGDMAVQGTGLPPRELAQRYTNTDYTFVDDTDVFDIWRALVTAREKFQKAYDLGQLVDSRERRQIVGDAFLSPMDMMLGRTHPDTVVIARSNFDSHGYIVHEMFLLRPPDKASIDVRVPWRCLLPKGIDGVIVTGLGVSAHRDAIPVIRMQPDIQNQGYAAGVAAAMISTKGIKTRELDIKALQRHLVKVEILPESVLTETDNFPLPREKVAEAVKAVTTDFKGLEVVLAHFGMARPMLRAEYAKASDEKTRVTYAHVLGMMGDATGAETLAKAVAETKEWDKGWNYRGMGQFGMCVSPLDSQIIALGRTKDKRALAPILEKANQLTVTNEFSHFRAVSLALEALGDKRAAKPLAALLQKEGIAGHAQTNIAVALERVMPSGTDNTRRNEQLIELYVARALYRCGDSGGLGEKTLRQYAQDLHGHYARHARAVLNQ
ncbi:MAG: FAD-dependent oxidoreductase [Verrucomicrobia bacterium]|nr:FAD-dependent oxidoreductase [Verrucomicrobiota bacterium]